MKSSIVALLFIAVAPLAGQPGASVAPTPRVTPTPEAGHVHNPPRAGSLLSKPAAGSLVGRPAAGSMSSSSASNATFSNSPSAGSLTGSGATLPGTSIGVVDQSTTNVEELSVSERRRARRQAR